MKVEKYTHGDSITDWSGALFFVHQHRNIFSDSVRRSRYGIINGAYVVKEVSRYKDDVERWFWCFYKNKYMIIQNPSKKDDIYKIVNDWVTDSSAS